MGKQWKQWLTLFFWAPKSLQIVIAAMKLKDAYSLEGKRSEEHTSELQSPSAVILEPRKIKSDTVSTVSPSISYEVMGPDAMIFVF